MTTRRLPRPSELLPLLNLSRPLLDLTARRLAGGPLDRGPAGRRRTPRAVFDYTDGAAEEEIVIDLLDPARYDLADAVAAPPSLHAVSGDVALARVRS
ncbi:MAG: hypothetical protein ACFCVF_06600 [Kineosporiaceae bacterium]